MEFSNGYAKGVSNYVCAFIECFALLLNYVPNKTKQIKHKNDNEH